MLNHILVPLDGSALAECVLSHAVAVARAFQARVTLLRVLERAPTAGLTQPVDPLTWDISKAEAEAYLDRQAIRLQKMGLSVDNAFVEGQAAESIIHFAHNSDVELIILSSHGRSGLSSWNISSVVQKIISRAYVTVMIVRAYQPAISGWTDLRYRRLLVPLDCSQRAEHVLPVATTLAHFHNAQLLLAHVVERPAMPRRTLPSQEDIELGNRLMERNRLEATKYLEELQSQMSIDVETRLLLSDDIAVGLHELVEQENVDLVVLSAHGYSAATKWPYGSVAASFISYGTTPLLIVQDLSPDEIEPTRAEVTAREHRGH